MKLEHNINKSHHVISENNNIPHMKQFVSEIMLMVNIWKSIKRDKTIRHSINFSINVLLSIVVYWFFPSIMWSVWIFSTIAVHAIICIFVVNVTINEQLRQAYDKIDKLEGLQYKKA